jgi:hypothetical protein
VEIRGYLNDAPITLADESSEIMTVVHSPTARRHDPQDIERSKALSAAVPRANAVADEQRHSMKAPGRRLISISPRAEGATT